MQTIDSSANKPLLVMQYPMHAGGYVPHLLYHTSSTNALSGDHQEKIVACCLTNPDAENPWGKPKPRSHSNATIALLLVDAHGTPHVRSIYIDNVVNPLQYASNPKYIERTSLSNNELNTMPSTEDFYQFVVNPEHSFTREQIQILKPALLKRFLSNHPKYIHAVEILNSQLTTPTFLDPYPTLPLPFNNRDLNECQQIIHATRLNPWVVPNYPTAYGEATAAKFWLSTTQATKHSEGLLKEVANVSLWNARSSTWSEPRKVSPLKHTICLSFKGTNSLSKKYNLPIFKSVDLYNQTEDNIDVVFSFAICPTHYFTAEQRKLILSFLLETVGANSWQFTQLQSHWANHPIVPPIPTQNIPT